MLRKITKARALECLTILHTNAPAIVLEQRCASDAEVYVTASPQLGVPFASLWWKIVRQKPSTWNLSEALGMLRGQESNESAKVPTSFKGHQRGNLTCF
jgi:hypothetical protein